MADKTDTFLRLTEMADNGDSVILLNTRAITAVRQHDEGKASCIETDSGEYLFVRQPFDELTSQFVLCGCIHFVNCIRPEKKE